MAAKILKFEKPRRQNPPKMSPGNRAGALIVVGVMILFVLANLKSNGFFSSSTGYQGFVVLAGLAVATLVIRKFNRS